jgi:hypothetical protein
MPSSDVENIAARLERSADPVLASWIHANKGRILRAIKTALVNVRRGASVGVAAPTSGKRDTGMTVEEAGVQAQNWAVHLLENTHFDPQTGNMEEDNIGASVGTLGNLRSFASYPDPAHAPLEVKLSVLEALRLHSKRQIDRGDWEAAYTAVSSAYELERGAPPPSTYSRVFHPQKSAASGLDDGTHYEHVKGQTAAAFPYKRGGPRVNDLLAAARIPREAYRWDKREGSGGTAFWLIIRPDWVVRVAAAVAEHYPTLAKALTQLAPVWSAMAPRPAAPASGAPAAPARDVSSELAALPLDPVKGVVEGVLKYKRVSDRDAVFLFDFRLGIPKEKLPKGVRWVKDDQGRWLLQVPIPMIRKLAEMLSDVPEAALIMNRLAEMWGAPSAGAPAAPEGRYTLLPSGYVKMYVDGYWKPSDAVKVLVRGKKEEAPAGSGAKPAFFWLFRARNVALVAEGLLADGYPGLAGALMREYGSHAKATAGGDPTCNPLTDMSGADGPAAVKHPIGRAVVAEVVDILRSRIPTGRELKPYQYVGVAFAKLTDYRCLIGDGMGLGKTAQALACLAVDPEKLLPAVVVVPSSVYINWSREVDKWLPTLPVHMLASGKSALPPKGWKGLVIVTWGLLSAQQEALQEFGVQCVIADEAHYAKNPTAARTKALVEMAETVPHLLLLSGTPLKNRTMELFSLLHMIDPDKWRSASEFGHAYADVEEIRVRGKKITKFSGGRNLEALREALRCYMVRRLKSDVLKDLPDKVHTRIPIDLAPSERKEYDRASKKFDGWLEEKLEGMRAEIEAKGQSVKGRLEKALQAEALVQIGYLRQLVGGAKITGAVEQIESFVETETPLIVFAEFQNVLKGVAAGLEKAGIKYGLIDGSVASTKKGLVAEQFQNGEFDVILCSQAAREGLNLYRASDVLFVEPWWVPADMEQAEDRAHRIGQKGSVTVWGLEARNTIDEQMYAQLDRKRAISEGAIGGTRQNQIALTEEGELSVMDVWRTRVQETAEGKKIARSKNPGDAPDNDSGIDPEVVHAVLFAAAAWTPSKAKHWLRMHRLNAAAVLKAGKAYRATNREKGLFRAKSFKVRKLGQGIALVEGTLR